MFLGKLIKKITGLFATTAKNTSNGVFFVCFNTCTVHSLLFVIQPTKAQLQ